MALLVLWPEEDVNAAILPPLTTTPLADTADRPSRWASSGSSMTAHVDHTFDFAVMSQQFEAGGKLPTKTCARLHAGTCIG